jgi:GNAT superfamily N-acetyltransferase
MAELCREVMAELAARERGGPLFVARHGRPEPVEEGLAQLVDDPGRMALVGTLDDVIVGYASGRVEDLRDGHRLGIIDELFVEEPARAVGVGATMMDLLLDWFRSQRCMGVDSTALPGARETKNFFEESGFSARLLVMYHRLES